MARSIEKEVAIGTDMPEGTKWEEEEGQTSEMDYSAILEDVYNAKNESYKVFQLARRVRELAKNITDGTYYVKDMDTLKEVSSLLMNAHNKLMSTKNPSGLPEMKGHDLRYKTLKELSKPSTFKGNFNLLYIIFISIECNVISVRYVLCEIGRDIIQLAKKRVTKKRNVGDIMGLLRVNSTIKEMKTLSIPPVAKRRRRDDMESNLWVSDVTDTDLLNVLDGLDLAEPFYVSEDTKSALLTAISKTDNILAPNFSDAADCKYCHVCY